MPRNFRGLLYLIEILHQTTTDRRGSPALDGCILLKFYIKPQRRLTVLKEIRSCILLKFYIKPQRRGLRNLRHSSCILLKFYIKPQLSALHCLQVWRCILLKFYIKPQLEGYTLYRFRVVSY